MTPTVPDKFTQSFLVSILFHGFAFLLLTQIAPHLSMPQLSESDDQRFEVKTLSQEEMQKFRTVGVKNGSKNYSEKTPPNSAPSRPKPRAAPQPSLKELGANVENVKVEQTKMAGQTKRVLEEKNESNPFKVTVKEGIKKAERLHQRKENLENDYMKDIGVSPNDQRFLKSSGFNIDFQPPEGVSEDELNTMEKIYYSFQKRTFNTYVNSFIKSYNAIELKRPQVKGVVQNEAHTLTGRITFDEEGNIVTIKILQSSPNDDIHLLFEETLKGIQRLPNPPKSLIKDGQLTIYYQLKIN